MKKLHEQVFVVTGSTQGLGEIIALHLADLGAHGIVLCGRDEGRGQKVAAALEERGCRPHFVHADLANAADCIKVMKEADARFHRVDGLVNSAASTARGTIENTSVELWDSMFAINTRAPFLLMQEAVRLMRRERRGGSIVNIITQSAHGGQPNLMAYSASKGALATLTKNVAHACRKDRIRVNGLMIGWMDTPGEHAIQKSDGAPFNWLELAQQRVPFGRILNPQEVATFAGFLLSSDGEMMTGSLIDFDQNVIGAYD